VLCCVVLDVQLTNMVTTNGGYRDLMDSIETLLREVGEGAKHRDTAGNLLFW
jgi:hypothetical protein